VKQAVEVMQAERGAQPGDGAGGEPRQLLDSMVTAVGTINDMNIQIATAAEEQHAVSEEINKNLVAIQQIVSELTEASGSPAPPPAPWPARVTNCANSSPASVTNHIFAVWTGFPDGKFGIGAECGKSRHSFLSLAPTL
jgi:hypothetical protein